MRLALFGATGRTGRHVLEQALVAGHEVTALTRSPGKLVIQHPLLEVIQGNILEIDCVERAVAGAGAVISALGPTSNQPTFEVSQGMGNILAAMKKNGLRRLVVSTGAGVSDPNDAPRLFNRLMGILVRRFARWVYEDMYRTVELVRLSDLDWVIVRVPMLTDAPNQGKVRVGWVGKGTGPRLTRLDLAAFMLQQVQDDSWLHQAPVISS